MGMHVHHIMCYLGILIILVLGCIISDKCNSLLFQFSIHMQIIMPQNIPKNEIKKKNSKTKSKHVTRQVCNSLCVVNSLCVYLV